MLDKQNSSNQPNQFQVQIVIDQGQPDITQDVISVQACSSEDDKSLNVEQTHDRSGQPDKHNVAVQEDPKVYHEMKTLNTDNETVRERMEEDIDFKIPGLPPSIVKQAHSASVRELIQKFEKPSKSTCSSTRSTTESII